MLVIIHHASADAQGTQVEKADIRRVYGLFQDLGRSVQFLKDYQAEFLFDEGEGAAPAAMETA